VIGGAIGGIAGLWVVKHVTRPFFRWLDQWLYHLLIGEPSPLDDRQRQTVNPEPGTPEAKQK
jgi:hypothetical protein